MTVPLRTPFLPRSRLPRGVRAGRQRVRAGSSLPAGPFPQRDDRGGATPALVTCARVAPPLSRPFPSPVCALPRLRPPPPAPYSWPSDASTATAAAAAAAAVFHSPQPATVSSPCHRPPPHAAPARRRHARGGSPRAERAAGARGRRSGSQRRGSCERPPPGGRRAVPPVSCHRGRGSGGGAGHCVTGAPDRAGCQGRGAGAHRPGGGRLGEPGRPSRVGCCPRFLPRRPGLSPRLPGRRAPMLGVGREGWRGGL